MIQFRLMNVSISASSCIHIHLTRRNGIITKLRNNINQPVSPNKNYQQYSSLSLSEPCMVYPCSNTPVINIRLSLTVLLG
jgi:hypothetical protein